MDIIKQVSFEQYYKTVVEMGNIKDALTTDQIKSIGAKKHQCHYNAYKASSMSSKYGTPIQYCEGLALGFIPHAFCRCETPNGFLYFDPTLGEVGSGYVLFRVFTYDVLVNLFSHFGSSFLTIDFVMAKDYKDMYIIDNNGKMWSQNEDGEKVMSIHESNMNNTRL